MQNRELRISCIGLGRVGLTLMRLFASTGKFKIGELIGRSSEQANSARQFVGAGRACVELTELRSEDVLVIAVRDREIEEVAETLARKQQVSKQALVFHCSGSISSQVLSKCGFNTSASVHPIFSFASPEIAVKTFNDVHCAYEGAAQAVPRLMELFEAIGAQLIEINSADKTLYHAACVFASNYTVAMCEIATSIFSKVGIEPKLGEVIAADLAASAIENVRRLGARAGLTGPAARGDLQVIEAHIDRLKSIDVELSELYLTLSQRLLRLVG